MTGRTFFILRAELAIHPDNTATIESLKKALFEGESMTIEQKEIRFTGLEVFSIERIHNPELYVFQLRETQQSVRFTGIGKGSAGIPPQDPQDPMPQVWADRPPKRHSGGR